MIAVEADEAKRKQILLELKTLHESMHPSIALRRLLGGRSARGA